MISTLCQWSHDPDHPLLPTELPIKLPIPFILQSYCLFHNTRISDLPTNQPEVEVMAVAWGEKHLFSSTDLLGAQWCNKDSNGLRLRSTSRRPRTYSKDIKARNTTCWTQWDRLSVGETSASNLLTTIVPKSKDEDLAIF